VKLYNGDTYQFIGQVKLEIDADLGLRLDTLTMLRSSCVRRRIPQFSVYQRDRYERGQEDKGHKDRL